MCGVTTRMRVDVADGSFTTDAAGLTCQFMSASHRLCCKSRKLQGHEFFAKTRSGKQSPIRTDAIALAKSPVSLTLGDEVPHVFTRKPRLRPLEFLIIGAKRLLQHNSPKATEILRCREMTLGPLPDSCSAVKDHHSITSSASASSLSGTVRPSTLAVFRLIISSNLVGCSTGMSPGFSPCRIMSVISAVRRSKSGKLGP